MTVADQLLDRTRDALNMTSSADDAEILGLLDSAVSEYAATVGGLPGALSYVLSGGPGIHLLPRGTTAVTAASYSDGTTIDTTGLTVDPVTAILYGDLDFGTRNVLLTLTVGDLPEHHLEAIVADVAELWTRTQRSGGGQRPTFGGDGFDPEPGRPLVLFPRIRGLLPTSSIA